MSMELSERFFMAVLISLTFLLVVFLRSRRENNPEIEGQKYLPYINGGLLPLFLLILFPLELVLLGTEETARSLLTLGVDVFLIISIYFGALLLVLPFLRKHFMARTCAMMWIIPNYLYMVLYDFMGLPAPSVVLRVPGRLIRTLFLVWIVGAVVFFVWKIISHLVFRKSILRQAYKVSDAAVIQVFRQEVEDAGMKKTEPRLLISPDVKTPVTIGLFRRTRCLVLPNRNYTMEELGLIFRHEIVHIGREDTWSKFFMMFCTAMCWFNPLMWIAMKKCADDLELSCDETVLLEADSGTRRKYAGLLLKTAGEGRGFTTCLSAAASTMQHRLKCVVKPPKRYSGAVIVGLVFFVLCMNCGRVALAYEENTGGQLLFGGAGAGQSQQVQQEPQLQPEDLHIQSSIIHRNSGREMDYLVCNDEGAFFEYLADLRVMEMTGNYTFSEYEKELTCSFATSELLFVSLMNQYMKVYFLDSDEARVYYLPDGVDWTYLESLFERETLSDSADSEAIFESEPEPIV